MQSMRMAWQASATIRSHVSGTPPARSRGVLMGELMALLMAGSGIAVVRAARAARVVRRVNCMLMVGGLVGGELEWLWLEWWSWSRRTKWLKLGDEVVVVVVVVRVKDSWEVWDSRDLYTCWQGSDVKAVRRR
jgi:hypothetical protein